MAHASRKVRKVRRQKRTTSLAKKQARNMFLELFKVRSLLAAVLLAKRTVTLAEHDLSEATTALVNGTGRINTVELPGKFMRVEFLIHKASTQGFDPETVTEPVAETTLIDGTDLVAFEQAAGVLTPEQQADIQADLEAIPQADATGHP